MRFAMCNELFDDRSLVDGFRAIALAGYEAVELAPFTLGRLVEDVRPAERVEIRRNAAGLGLGFTGLHWLLARTEGMHIAASEPEVRARTLGHLNALTELCADLGGHVLVFGSPRQRSTPAGMTVPDARARSIDLFGAWAARAEQTGTTICLEALPADETDFMNTTDEVIEVVRAVASPAVRVVLDVKSMSTESRPIPDQIARAAPHLSYVQANDANRGGPGFGATDFVPIFRALAEAGYDGDVSVEAFEVATDVDDLARRSYEYLSRCAAA